ncbi:MAG: hypothetical protein D6681_18195 [Calditrichaeota bacterium]|nr:MAG: hypothetical protein D6681_18195 [Calditrichota bacterium]
MKRNRINAPRHPIPFAGLLWIAWIGWMILCPAVLAGELPSPNQAPDQLESKVIEIFSRNCALSGCHTGSTPMMGLKLTPDEFYARLVNRPSTENPTLMRVKPGDPDSSYLIMKIVGHPDIIGARMPFGRDPLTDEEIAVIVEWVQNLTEVDVARLQQLKADPVLPFYGWKVVNLPTTRMVDKGDFLFLISHRFFPSIKDGYDSFYGLDGSGIIFLNLGYAITDRVFVNLGRSNVEDEVELNLKVGLKQQYPDDRWPISAAAQATVNWITEKRGEESRTDSRRFKFAGQIILSSQLREGLGVNVVPAILFNPNSEEEGEDPLITIGLAGRVHVWKSISLIGEWVPIVSGYTLTSTLGEFNRFDSWGAGIELAVGGHAFHIVVSNSAGLTTDQYMRGGSFDIRDGDLRLGFNIFRPLRF